MLKLHAWVWLVHSFCSRIMNYFVKVVHINKSKKMKKKQIKQYYFLILAGIQVIVWKHRASSSMPKKEIKHIYKNKSRRLNVLFFFFFKCRNLLLNLATTPPKHMFSHSPLQNRRLEFRHPPLERVTCYWCYQKKTNRLNGSWKNKMFIVQKKRNAYHFFWKHLYAKFWKNCKCLLYFENFVFFGFLWLKAEVFLCLKNRQTSAYMPHLENVENNFKIWKKYSSIVKKKVFK